MAYLEAYGQYIDIEIDTAVIDADLTHFPLPVPLSSVNAADVFAQVGADYFKIAVTMADGITHLFVEVEEWDATGEKALLWVSRDTWTIPATGTPFVRLYFSPVAADNTAYVGTPGHRPEVWDSDFAAVYNFAQNPATENLIDSTANRNDATPSSTFSSGDLVDGLIGKGWQFSSADDDEVIAPHSASLDLSGEAAIEIVTYYNSQGTSYSRILYKEPLNDSYEVRAYSGGVQFLNNTSEIVSYQIPIVDSWYIFGMRSSVVDNEARLFVDGVLEDTKSSVSGFSVTSGDLRIGRRAGYYTYDGIIASIRLSKTARGPAWNRANGEAQSKNLLIFGSTQATVELTNIVATVNLSGSPVTGATVFIINATRGTIAAEVLTDSIGQISVDVSSQHTAGDLYHLCAEHEDGGTYYNGNSKPFINPEV